MTHDPVDDNDDGIVDADVDNGSIKTEQLYNTVQASGYGDADNADALQPAVDAADHGVVDLDADLYYPQATVNLVAGGDYLIGKGAGTKPDFSQDPASKGTVIHVNGDSTADPVLQWDQSTDYGIENHGFEKILLSGNGSAAQAVNLNDTRRAWVRDSVFYNFTGDVIRCDSRHLVMDGVEFVANSGGADDFSIRYVGNNARQGKINNSEIANTNGGLKVGSNANQSLIVSNTKFSALDTNYVEFEANTDSDFFVTFNNVEFTYPGAPSSNNSLHGDSMIKFLGDFAGTVRFDNCDFIADDGSVQFAHAFSAGAGVTVGNLIINDSTFTGFSGSVFDMPGQPVSDIYTSQNIGLGEEGNKSAKLVATYEQSGDADPVTHTLTGLSPGSHYILEFSGGNNGVAGSLNITFNGDNAGGNANYEYWDETGTRQTGQDAIEVLDYSSYPRFEGNVVVRGGEPDRVGLDNQLTIPRPGDLNGYADRGGWSKAEALSSLTVESTGGLSDGTTIKVWEGF